MEEEMVNHKPILKAWQIQRLPQNNEAVYMQWIDTIVVDENEHKARRQALHHLREYDIEEDDYGIEFTYITIRLKRSPDHDKYLVDGVLKNKFDMDQDKEKFDRDEGFRKLLLENPNGFAYIIKGGNYYRPNNCGYTEFKNWAGVYSLKDAVNECLGMSLRDCMYPVLIDIQEHNDLIKKEIELLKSKLTPC